jgi:hypothetical protein
MLIAIVAQKATFALMSPIRAYQNVDPVAVVGMLMMAVHCQLVTLIMLKKRMPKPRNPMKGTVQEIIWSVLCPPFGGE